MHVFNLIKDVQKTFKTREQEIKEMEVGGSDTHSILASFPGLSHVCSAVWNLQFKIVCTYYTCKPSMLLRLQNRAVL